MKKMMIKLAMVVLPFTSVASFADTTYFFDGVFGQANQNNSIGGFDAISGSDASKGFRAGFYLYRHWGLEFTHMDFGIADDTFTNSFSEQVTNTMNSQWNGVGFQGGFPIAPRLIVTGRLGLAAWELDFTERNNAFPGDVFRDGDEGVDIYAGVGLRFEIEDNIRVSLEYEGMDMQAALGSADTDHTLQNVAVTVGVLF